MTTQTSKPEAALARRHAAYIKAAMGDTPYTMHDELRFEGRVIDRVVLTADDVTVYQYKTRLNADLVEQCRELCGVADFVWAVCGGIDAVKLAAVNLTCGIGFVHYFGNGFAPSSLPARRQLNAQPDRLREACRQHSGHGEAGAQHGERTREAVFLDAVREAIVGRGKVKPGLAVRWAAIDGAKSPWVTPQRTINAIKRNPPDWLHIDPMTGEWTADDTK